MDRTVLFSLYYQSRTVHGSYVLTIHLLMEQKVIYHTITLEYIGPATEQYPLTISGFDGTTTDPFSYHNGMKFTTRDRGNDHWSANCEVLLMVVMLVDAWWYKSCSIIHPNHQHNHSRKICFNNQWHPLPFIEIKIRPEDCNFISDDVCYLTDYHVAISIVITSCTL